MSIVVVAYPRPASGEVKFNEDYYINTHMPLVQKLWGPLGLKSWTVSVPAEGPHVMTAALRWESHEAFETAAKGDTASQIFGDVPNFTDIKPELLKATVKAHWSA